MHFPRLIVALNFLLFSGLVANAQHICGASFLRARTESEQLEESLTRDERAAQLQKRNGCNDDNVLRLSSGSVRPRHRFARCISLSLHPFLLFMWGEQYRQRASSNL
jgi:hypothetical protein